MIAALIAAGVFDIAVPPFPYTVEAPEVRTARAQVGLVTLAWPSKDADETLDFGNDMSSRIADPDDVITATQAETVTGSVVVEAHYVNTATGKPLKTTTWLSGGAEGQRAEVRVRSVTAAGRRLDQTIELTITAR